MLTHDSDFGHLAIAAGEPVYGILYLRPGHIEAELTIATVQAILAADLDITPPCMVGQ